MLLGKNVVDLKRQGQRKLRDQTILASIASPPPDGSDQFLDSLSASIMIRILEKPARPGLHDCQKPTNVEVTIKLLGLALPQGTGPSLRGKFVNALFICRRKLHREQIPCDVGGDCARVGFDYARKNGRFGIRCELTALLLL